MFDGDVNGSRRIGKLILLYSNIHLRKCLLHRCWQIVCFTAPQPKTQPNESTEIIQFLGECLGSILKQLSLKLLGWCSASSLVVFPLK